ncbi:MAG: UvrD-helicase domain-containing protein [Oscillospiraceae bacterium]|nr:UvrD-helicase domain-containing protein [Oscillospiraceae bacterium]
MDTQQLEKRFADARRAVIAREFSYLNDMQLEGVLATEGPLLILAGAGSGKTTVLINRIANLMEFGRASDSDDMPEWAEEADLEFLEGYLKDPRPEWADRARSLCALEPVAPWRIMAITFTNKAASELKTRLLNRLGEAAEDVWAQTFHSACVRILRRDIEVLGYSRSFTIYDTDDSLGTIKRILKDRGVDEKSFPPRSVLSAISRAKQERIGPREFAAEAAMGYDLRKKHLGELYTEYEHRLKEAEALDFDDLLLRAVELLESSGEVLSYYRRRFKYVLIDEYQDTNKLQERFAALIAGESGNLCVVGDDDQSIYKFRGATIDNILDFEKRWPGARVIRLEQNYRSTGHILAASNAVIQHNQGRKGKKLWTSSGEGDRLLLHVSADEAEEARYVGAAIRSGVLAGKRYSDYAVLYRTNAQSNQFEYAFRSMGIPYRVVGGMRFFDRAEVKDMLAWLCFLNNQSDDLRLMRIINNPPRGIGTRTVETARALADREGSSLYQVISRCREYPELSKSAGKLCVFTDLVDELRESLSCMPLDEFYDELCDKSGFAKALSGREHESRLQNVQELKTNIQNYISSTVEPDLAGFLDESALYMDTDKLDENDDCVVMMTIHSAKGLEFPTVFMVGVEDGLFPGNRAIGEPEEMEEERRLCYVAMTRAKEHLIISHAEKRMIYGRTAPCMASRFIEEIPSEDIERPARPSRSFVSAVPGGHGYSRPAVKKYTARAPAGPKSSLKMLSPGDVVQHRIFGEGVVQKVTPMGGDALLEISFERVGTKRLMHMAAAAAMEKK